MSTISVKQFLTVLTDRLSLTDGYIVEASEKNIHVFRVRNYNLSDVIVPIN
jgi:hypothetical protein